MEGEYVLPLKMKDDGGKAEYDFMIVLNKKKKIVWANEKAVEFFDSNIRAEEYLELNSLEEWYKYLENLKRFTIKKSQLSLMNKNNQLLHFIGYGMYDQWNGTYMISFRPVTDPLPLFELYDQTFKMLDEIHIGAFVSRVNGFIFSVNETANSIVPNACQMSIVELLRRFFDEEQFDHYIELLNRRESFSVVVTCKKTFKNYHLTHKFDSDFELHIIMIRHHILKGIAEQQSKSFDYLDKQTVASIVHEIRNPLTALQGFVDLMQEDGIPNKQYLQVLDYELRRLDHLLSGMLQILKPKTELIPIECNSFLKKILSLLENDVKNKNICLVYGMSFEPCYILGNEYSLIQVFQNIIKNSTQAMGEGGSIVISFNKAENNELEVCIKDSGSGMSEEQLVKLFTPYYTTKEGGTGLGLSIVKKLLEEMGGRIEVRSELGKGTEVYLYLKLASECDCHFTN